MSLAGFNPDVSLLTPHPNAQIHVFSGGGDGPDTVVDKRRVDDMLKKIGFNDDDIRGIRACTADYEKITFGDEICNSINFKSLYDKIEGGPYKGLLDENNMSVLSSLAEAVPAIPAIGLSSGKPLRDVLNSSAAPAAAPAPAAPGHTPFRNPLLNLTPEQRAAIEATAEEKKKEAAAAPLGTVNTAKEIFKGAFKPGNSMIASAIRAQKKGGAKKTSRRIRKLRHNRKKAATTRTRARTMKASRK
jgi:hypothetical protein